MKKALAVLLIFTLSVSQVGQSCRGENVNSVSVIQKEQGEHGEKTSQQELNEKVLARLNELETKIDKKEDKKEDKEETPKNIFVKVFSGIKKGVFFVIKKFFWLLAVLGTYTAFSYLFLIKRIEKVIDKSYIEELIKSFDSAMELFMFLRNNKELANGILNKLFENISGNCGDHEPTSEEKKKILEFLKNIMKIFSEENVKNLKNFDKNKAEKIFMLASGLENQLKGK